MKKRVLNALAHIASFDISCRPIFKNNKQKGTEMKAQSYLPMVLLTLLFFNISYAQPRQPVPPQKGELLKQLAERLDLTLSQAKKIENILDITQKRMDQFRPERNEGERPSMEIMDEIIGKQDQEIEKVLDKEQRKEFAKMKKEREMNRPPMGDIPEPPRN
ncbi:MAG: hypothetical protein Q8S39_11975 [Ignavibacteria bacterium]|nr:hypothetical protein [Ignavibacteria bacterium]